MLYFVSRHTLRVCNGHSCQKLGIILENKVLQKLLSKISKILKCSPKSICISKGKWNQKNSSLLLTLKVRFWSILKKKKKKLSTYVNFILYSCIRNFTLDNPYYHKFFTDHDLTTFFLQVSKRPFGSDLRRHVVSVSSDKTLVCRQPDGRGLTVGTIPHPVIGLIGDPVMADSFPMAGKYFTLDTYFTRFSFTFVKHFNDQNVVTSVAQKNVPCVVVIHYCTWYVDKNRHFLTSSPLILSS